MPNYDYFCECGYTEEVRHSIHDSPEVKCSKCEGVMKINVGSNTPHIKFKGYGWPGEDIKKGATLKKSEYKKKHKIT